MRTFSSIKKYSKPSLELDEKISVLNKELEKTDMLSEKMTTSSVYPEREVQAYIPPTLSDVPDNTGILGNSFSQPTNGGDDNDSDTWADGWNSNAYLTNADELDGVTNRSIVSHVPNSPYGDGGGGIVITGRYFGRSIGYLSGENVYKQVLSGGLSGGTNQPTEDSRGRGGWYNGLTDAEFAAAVSFWNTHQSLIHEYGYNGIPTVTVKAWVVYNRYHDYQVGGEFADWTGGPKKTVGGQKLILETSFAVVKVKSSVQYTSDPGQPYIGATRSFGDPDYYPGPVMSRGSDATRIAGGTSTNWNLYNWMMKTYGMPAAEWYNNNPGKPPSSNPHLPRGAYVPLAMGGEIMNKLNMSPEATNVLISAIYDGLPPRNSPGGGPVNVQGPHQPVKYYPGMGFAPVGPVKDPWKI